MAKIDFKGKTILAVGAHPDDNDFGSGGTIAKAAKQGARIIYLLATSGQRGSNDKSLTQEKLSEIRKKEQLAAAKILGVKEIIFLDYCDGELVANLELKEKITRLIRQYKPDIVFAPDPSRFYFKESGFINHSDHRAIGEAALAAVYPLSRDLLSFPEHQKIGLKPHKVKELLLPAFLLQDANLFIDISDTLKIKFKALSYHKSQIKDFRKLKERMQKRAAETGNLAGGKFAEGFVYLKLPL